LLITRQLFKNKFFNSSFRICATQKEEGETAAAEKGKKEEDQR
jgi:hypothetical protein